MLQLSRNLREILDDREMIEKSLKKTKVRGFYFQNVSYTTQ